MGNRFHIAPENAISCCIWRYKSKIIKNIWRKYWKVFENLLTKCEYGAILCTEKNENKIKIWLFSLGSTALSYLLALVFGYGAIDRRYRRVWMF